MSDSKDSVTNNNVSELAVTKGKVLLVGNGLTTAKVESLLINNAWAVDIAETVDQFSTSIENENYSVVVTVFSDDEEMLRSIEYHALSKHSTKWIAIIPNDGWLKRHANRRFSQVFYDYHRVPIIPERFIDTVGHAYGMATFAKKELDTTSQHRVLMTDASVDEIIGKSQPVRELRRMIELVSNENLTVLIMGESGSGKELVARNIHLQSSRSQHPFVAINCASMPENLIHQDLFGHEKGAYPGADKRTIGKIESADFGTLFLDKISDMPMSVQVSLLRFLETRKIQRLGGIQELEINCCIVLAAGTDLPQAVEEGRFREDLFHRINVIPVKIPALREHPSDISLLAEHFLARFSEGKEQKYFASECLQSMQSYSWPGNVRELMNKIKRAVVLSKDKAILSSDIGLENLNDTNIVDLSTARQLAEQKAILDALESTGNNHTLAAAKLGISRTSLYRLLAKFEDTSERA